MPEHIDFGSLRETMVECQLLPRGINGTRLIDAFKKIPRHRFVPLQHQKSSYGDFPLPIGNDQTISQPYIVALMTQALTLRPSDRVLEIGTGSGYQTAILASLAKTVYSVERIEKLAHDAKRILHDLGFANIHITVDDGTLGWKEYAPYDKIIVTAAAPHLPKPLEEQIGDGGKIVVPISADFGQALTVFTKEGDSLTREVICGCTFVPLIGKHAYTG